MCKGECKLRKIVVMLNEFLANPLILGNYNGEKEKCAIRKTKKYSELLKSSPFSSKFAVAAQPGE